MCNIPLLDPAKEILDRYKDHPVCVAKGVTIENVAKMLGHSDTKMTRHYARVLDKSIMRDMTVVNSKFITIPETPAVSQEQTPVTNPVSTTLVPIPSIEIPILMPQSRSVMLN